MQSLEKHVNFENENSRKAYYREFKKVCTVADVLVLISIQSCSELQVNFYIEKNSCFVCF